MEPWYELLKKERNARLMTQQEVAEAINTDARTVRMWESGQSFPSKYYRRKLCEFYGKEAKDLGLDEETAIQKSKQVRSQKNGVTIVHDPVLFPVKENIDDTSPALVETNMVPNPDVPPAKSNEPVPHQDDSSHLLPLRRIHMSPLQVGGAVLIVALIITTLLWSRGIFFQHDSTSNLPRKTPGTTLPPPLFFGFDGSTQGWGTSEGDYKLAKVSDASNPVYSGTGSLEVTSALIGKGSPHYPGNDVYTHTEATDYFGVHDLNAALVTCYVYLPPELAPGGTSPGYIRIFVKDTHYRNDFGDAVIIDASKVGSWIPMSFPIDANQDNEDQGFDASHVNAIGIRIDLNDGSMLDYFGPFYIDSCSL